MCKLREEIEALADGLSPRNYSEQVEKGFQILVRYKENGTSQKEAEETLMPLFGKYKFTAELKFGFIGDLLDCIVGWVGNRNWYIYNGQWTIDN